MDNMSFVSASAFALDALADIFTRSFEAYFYPGITSAETLALRVRVEQIDLHASPVLLLDDAPAGVALLALRGERAWCGGFGLMLHARGRGLAHRLCAELIGRARATGARRFGLEVLTRNQPAIKTYTRAGLQIERDLLILEWNGSAVDRPAPAEPAVSAEPRELLAHYDALHAVPAAWQYDLPALLARTNLRALALPHHSERPYLLYGTRETGRAHIADLAAHDPSEATALLESLQALHPVMNRVNEPADSPLLPAYFAAGFTESDRQHEMGMDLAGY